MTRERGGCTGVCTVDGGQLVAQRRALGLRRRHRRRRQLALPPHRTMPSPSSNRQTVTAAQTTH